MLTERDKRAKPPTADVQAYDFYLRGRQLFYQFGRKGLESARQMFARAIEIDPGYARAYAGVADCCSFLSMYHGVSAALKEAEAASKKAVELDPESAEAHASRGVAGMLREQYEHAAEEFEAAIRLNPKLFEAYYFYARARFTEGKLEEAARLFERACQLSPGDFQAPSLLGQVYRSLGREEDTRAVYQRALEIIEEHLQLHPEDVRALYLGATSLCEIGERERGLEYARRALALDPDDPTVQYNVACVFSLAGLTDEAIDCLEKSIALGATHREWIENDSDLDPVRDHPRFQTLLDRL